MLFTLSYDPLTFLDINMSFYESWSKCQLQNIELNAESQNIITYFAIKPSRKDSHYNHQLKLHYIYATLLNFAPGGIYVSQTFCVFWGFFFLLI